MSSPWFQNLPVRVGEILGSFEQTFLFTNCPPAEQERILGAQHTNQFLVHLIYFSSGGARLVQQVRRLGQEFFGFLWPSTLQLERLGRLSAIRMECCGLVQLAGPGTEEAYNSLIKYSENLHFGKSASQICLTWILKGDKLYYPFNFLLKALKKRLKTALNFKQALSGRKLGKSCGVLSI